LGCVALLFGPLACQGVRGKGWNVVLVTLDTTRADALGCYGAPGNPTPHLDALAQAGARFDMAISSSALTPVSHATILSGLDNHEHGLRVLAAGSGFRLSNKIPTLATILRENGYHTAAIHSAFPVSSWFGFANGFQVFDSFDTTLEAGQGGKWNVLEFQRRSDETTDLVLDWLTEEERPFFLWVHYWDPHDAVKVPPISELPAQLPRNAQGQLLHSRELYAAEVRYVDAQFGRLVEALGLRNELERTLFVVVADHGEGLGDHDWFYHRLVYQEQIRVPLIVKVPELAPSGAVLPVVRSRDIQPTVLDYLGLRAPRPVSGRSLRNLLEGRADEPRIAFADQINGYDLNASMVQSRPHDDFLYMVIDGKDKLIWRPNHPERSELFDLAADPRELDNRLTQDPATVERLLVHLAKEQPWVSAPFPKEVSTEDLAGARNVLEGLGYVGNDSTAGAPSQWVWFCPRHPGLRVPANGPCQSCGSLKVLIKAP
jgi:arylsulfatase A-like enzyme